jgi:5-(carboxyamino)imidazole ribonucleotide synthase
MVRLGIFGGGQLAQMTTQAAISLGIETVIFERHKDSPAGRLTHHEFVGAWDDEPLLAQFIALSDVITLESEFVDLSTLKRVEALQGCLYPTAYTLEHIQDKLTQKNTMANVHIPLPSYAAIETTEDILKMGEAWGYPLILKARRDSYDGYGNVRIDSPQDIQKAFDKLNGRAVFVEAFVLFVRELAVMVARNRSGEIRVYPVVETIQHHHICHVVRAPAPISPSAYRQATEIAIQAVEALQGVGVFGIELFLLPDDRILFNEIAPRPHNSGHYTIEGCVTSQFENHIRSVMGWPLGPIDLRASAVVMVNVLGKNNRPATLTSLSAALAVQGAHVHLYGKREARIGRKMGHVTVLANTLEAAEVIARSAADQLDL